MSQPKQIYKQRPIIPHNGTRPRIRGKVPRNADILRGPETNHSRTHPRNQVRGQFILPPPIHPRIPRVIQQTTQPILVRQTDPNPHLRNRIQRRAFGDVVAAGIIRNDIHRIRHRTPPIHPTMPELHRAHISPCGV